ncbi:U4/U6.U5 snRNP associated protein [Coelomomyces lativittatus]|nr:U4/U6.U5 snRNP associated protein [Coelomomyces lativittatus]KAJ1500903.1 U4/U6.U5 snRNP associated protein [Coelomomyces lativittatus]
MSDVNFRRTWPEKKSSTTSSSTSSTRKKEFTRPLYSTDTLKLLEARSKKVNFDAIVGKTQMVMAGTGAGAQAGFYCSLCDKLCKDNVAFLDHLNSPLHARNTGHKMEIKRATVESVKARLEYHKRKRLEVKEDYGTRFYFYLLKHGFHFFFHFFPLTTNDTWISSSPSPF